MGVYLILDISCPLSRGKITQTLRYQEEQQNIQASLAQYPDRAELKDARAAYQQARNKALENKYPSIANNSAGMFAKQPGHSEHASSNNTQPREEKHTTRK